ncbi:unnamed protein product [Owenia fusiformis]|uniref:Uncharacterized protein n=1 Tax=Owenia fusiformis TaxID=6347 RepID=A0A8J1XVV5_OWEFU|nr:unnamed protein product [Owenia fusiformis]
MAHAINLILFTCITKFISGQQVFQFDQGQYEPPPLKKGTFDVGTDPFGTYRVTINQKDWFKSSDSFFHIDGKVYSTHDGTLQLQHVEMSVVVDNLGSWEYKEYQYVAGKTRINLSFKSQANAVIFGQEFVDGATNCSVHNRDGLISGFPSLASYAGQVPTGFLSYGGIFTGHQMLKYGRYLEHANSGMFSGPLVVFDNTSSAIVISSFNHFMTSQRQHNSSLDSLSWGLVGNVSVVPPGFKYETIIYYSDDGINKAMEGWGEMLRKKYNKNLDARNRDLTLNYLGYWTDNGGYYYFNTEGNKTYEDTILDVKQYAVQQKIPYRYLQLDCYWYNLDPPNVPPYKNGKCSGATLTWDATNRTFPHGLKYLWQKTGWPVHAHNKFWHPKTPYAKKNGGNFDFFIDNTVAIPQGQEFWSWLFMESKQWGLSVYEQDFMEIPLMSDMVVSNVSLGRDWLVAMGKAAEENGLNLQYCMTASKEILQSLEIPAVTQARASNDFLNSGPNQWKIGATSMFADAVGLAPSKDNFWTTSVEPGDPYGGKSVIASVALECLIATLSMGPVGNSDKIGYTNRSLLMRCCNEDGLILKPTKPATPIDRMIKQRAFQDGAGPAGECYSTYSQIGSMESATRFGILLAADNIQKWTSVIGPADAGFGTMSQYSSSAYYFSYKDPSTVFPFSGDQGMKIANCTVQDFCLYYASPAFEINANEYLILGELEKWVPVSSKRVTDITYTEDDIVVTLTGAPKEAVKFWFYDVNQSTNIGYMCTLDMMGMEKVSLFGKVGKCVKAV